MSATKKCKGCQSEIDAKAKKCPQCQTDLRNWFAKHKIFSGIGIIIVIAVIASAASQSGEKTDSSSSANTDSSSSANTSAPASQEKPADSQPAAPEVTPVDITAFIAEFDANKIAAQDKYKDKYVQLTGFVSNISGGDFGGIYVVIDPNQGEDMGYGVTTPYFGTNVQCYPEKSDVASLTNGQQITVKGQVEDMKIMSVQLKNCSVVK